MIEELETPEIPQVQPLTHSFVERITIDFPTYNDPEGKPVVTVTKVKGHISVLGTFVKDASTRKQFQSDVDIDPSTKTGDIPAIVLAKVKDREDKQALAHSLREQADAIQTDRKL